MKSTTFSLNAGYLGYPASPLSSGSLVSSHVTFPTSIVFGVFLFPDVSSIVSAFNTTFV